MKNKLIKLNLSNIILFFIFFILFIFYSNLSLAIDCETAFKNIGESSGAFDINQPTIVSVCEGLYNSGAFNNGEDYYSCGHGFRENTNSNCWWTVPLESKVWSNGISGRATPYVGNYESVKKILLDWPPEDTTVIEDGNITWFESSYNPTTNDGTTRGGTRSGFMCKTNLQKVKLSDKMQGVAACKEDNCYVGVHVVISNSNSKPYLMKIYDSFIKRNLCDVNIFEDIEDSQCPEGYLYEDNACIKEESKSSTSILPDNVEIIADGKTEQKFVLTLIDNMGKPASGQEVTLDIIDSFNRLNSIGKLSSNKIITDNLGKATFTYTSGILTEENKLEEYSIKIQARHSIGNPVANIVLVNSRPRIKIVSVDPRTLQDDDTSTGGVSMIKFNIVDINSNKWNYEIKTDIGTVVSNENEGKNIVGTTENNFVNFRWITPDNKVEVRDFELTMDRNDVSAYDSFKNNMDKSFNDLLEDQDGKTLSDAKTYFNDLKGSWNHISEDFQRLKGSTSSTEKFLNMLSTGVEGMQVFYGSKSMLDSAKDYISSNSGEMTDQNEGVWGKIKNGLRGTRDATIGYGADLLQSRLRSWADAERERNLETIRLPVTITIKVTDEDGLFSVEKIILQYTYHFNPNIHFDRINNPNAD